MTNKSLQPFATAVQKSVTKGAMNRDPIRNQRCVIWILRQEWLSFGRRHNRGTVIRDSRKQLVCELPRWI